MESFNGRKKLTIINLSLFTNLADSFSLPNSSTSPNNNKSPRIFQNNSAVGLSIVAAMTNNSSNNENILLSSPIPIAPSSSANKKPKAVDLAKQEIINNNTTDDAHHHHHHHGVDELSESYTCVISHFGNNSVHKRVFFDDDDAEVDDGDKMENYSVFFASSSPPMNVGFENKRDFWSRDFLSTCFLCSKKLHGLDIFMYRGEKAFCSAECRVKQITSDDDLKENCGSEARKQLDYSLSPCSGPQPIFTSVAMA